MRACIEAAGEISRAARIRLDRAMATISAGPDPEEWPLERAIATREALLKELPV